MSFIGYCQLEATLAAAILTRDASRTPSNLDAAPSVRVYGPLGLLPLAGAVGSFLDSKAITGATNATPIVVTSVAHGLTTGMLVTITGVLGDTGANGTYLVTVLTADTFSLTGSVGNGAYVSGGTWNVAGLYTYSIVASAANGFEVGVAYTALIEGLISGLTYAETQVFIVV